MLDSINKLASDINAAWSRVDYSDAAFPGVSCELLRRPLDLDFSVLARSVSEGLLLPQQRRLDQGFGQPAITLYYGRHFLIEALCWHTSTPAIHQHSFSGAFRVITGRSVHSRYTYLEHCRSGRLSMGELRLECAEVLESGSTLPIPKGSSLIHANFHMDSPTLTLVVRTHQVAEPELTYLPPGVAYDPSDRDMSLHKRIELLDTMHQVKDESYLECVNKAISSSDEYDGMAIAMRAGARVDDTVFRQILLTLQTKHGPKIDLLIPALIEERRRSAIVRLRSSITDSDNRFFLATLLSFSSREDLLDMMTKRYGDSETASVRVADGVGSLLGGGDDRRIVSATAASAMLNDVPVECFPGWASRRWGRVLPDDEIRILMKYYEHVLEHPFLTPLGSRCS